MLACIQIWFVTRFNTIVQLKEVDFNKLSDKLYLPCVDCLPRPLLVVQPLRLGTWPGLPQPRRPLKTLIAIVKSKKKN